MNFGQKSDGAHGSRLEEPLVLDLSYQIQWCESKVNLAELAKLRWIEDDLSLHYGLTRNAINKYCQNIRKKNFDLPGLPAELAEMENPKSEDSVRIWKDVKEL